MTKLFLILISILALYLGFTVITRFDTATLITIGDYAIQTTLFTLCVGFIAVILVTVITLNIVSFIFGLPFAIQQTLHSKKLQNYTNLLLLATTQIIIDNKQKARKILNKIQSDIKTEHQEQFTLLLATAGDEFDHQIEHLVGLANSNNYGYYALKKLAQLFYSKQLYKEAENYAVKAFNINEFDIEIMQILLHCYGQMHLWTKLGFIISKIKLTSEATLSNLSNKISEYYFTAAKSVVEQGNDAEALNYLDLSLHYTPSYVEALSIYISLNNNLNHNANIQSILKAAFTAKPSFEIAELYIRSSNLTNLRVYEELAELVDPKMEMSVFLSIAAFLDLPDKIALLKEQKLLTVYN